jgi:hypothetical protein
MSFGGKYKIRGKRKGGNVKEKGRKIKEKEKIRSNEKVTKCQKGDISVKGKLA